MSGARLPAVRLPTVIAGQSPDEENVGESPVVVDLPPSNKFGFAWPTESATSVPLPLAAERPVGVSFSSSEGETDISEEELSRPAKRSARVGDGEESDFVTPTNNMDSDQNPMDQAAPASQLPRLSRAFSMPLPSQLGSLRNPRRVASSPDSDESTTVIEPLEYGHFHELSLELADSVQMVIQMLLQLSPPQVLDPAKEQFSACSLSIPTPSISAMFTSMKNLNYMSANMSALSLDPPIQQTTQSGDRRNVPASHNDFDVGEMLQSVGDALSGVAAQAGVDLVLFHGDLGMKHVAVKGDESGLSYTLSHVIRQNIATARPGDTIEVGLFIEAVPSSASEHAGRMSPSLNADDSLRCTFHIAHGTSPTNSPSSSSTGASNADSISSSPTSPSFRLQPSFKSLFLRRLLTHVGASLNVDVEPIGSSSERSHELVVTLRRGSPNVVDSTFGGASEEEAYPGSPEFRISQEPTLEQLMQFAESLRGRKVTLFANSKGSFAQHLTSYLTAWGMDVSHVSTEPDADSLPEHMDGSPESASSATTGRDDVSPAVLEQSPALAPPSAAGTPGPEPVSFYLIDDDFSVLRTKLQKIRAEQAYPLHLNARKRPSLANHHRPRSSPQVARVMGLTPVTNSPNAPPPVIVHFTSLSNFKLVKDAIQAVLVPGIGSASRLPEVIVIPKPAGPRRVLTALHTAITKPVVDPFFYPIATSPISPGFHAISPFFSMSTAARSPGGRSNTSIRTSSDKCARSPKDPAPSSPRGVSDTMEYFSDAAAKLGTSPASGLVIQSPDGQPAGIFFHPKPKGPGSKINLPIPVSDCPAPTYEQGGRARGVLSRRTSDDVKAGGLAVGSAEVARRASRSSVQEGTDPEQQEGNDDQLRAKRKGIPSGEALPPITVESPVSAGVVVGSPIAEPSSSTSSMSRSASRKSGLVDPLLRQDSLGSPSRAANASTRRSRRPNLDSLTSAPAAVQKKGKPNDANIVPRISVLIVDDNPINQTILSTFMKKKRIKFDVAKNGEEAVVKWQTGGFHLILMDIQMPVMDGIEATKQIRHMEKSNAAGAFPSTPQSEGQRTPSDASASESRSSTLSTPPYRSSVIIVALTASSLQSDRVAALAAGCNDFLTKPVSLHWLNSKIIEWGSIKALQMWADIRPDVVKSISSGQAVQAQKVARRLHVPEGRTPTDSRSRSSSLSRNRQAALEGSVAAANRLADDRRASQRTPLVAQHDESPGSTGGSSTDSTNVVAGVVDPIAEPEIAAGRATSRESEDTVTISAQTSDSHHEDDIAASQPSGLAESLPKVPAASPAQAANLVTQEAQNATESKDTQTEDRIPDPPDRDGQRPEPPPEPQ